MKRLITPLVLLLCVFISFAQNANDIYNYTKHPQKLTINKTQENFNLLNEVDREIVSAKSDFGDAPDWEWTSKFGGSANDIARNITTDSDGNVYIIGSFYGEISIESSTLTTTGEREAIIAKFSNAGDLQWIKKITAEAEEVTDAFGIAVDDLNNVYVTGYYTGSVSLGTFNLPDNAEYNLFLTKLNSAGEYLMAVNHGNVGEYEVGLEIDLDESGNIYIVGSTQWKTGWRHESFVSKYDNSGTLLWMQEHDENLSDIVVAENHYYITGTREPNHDGVIDDDVSVDINSKYANVFLLKSDLDGDYLWGSVGDHEDPNSGADSFGSDIDIDERENIYMSGYFRTEVILGNDTLTGSVKGYVTKVDSSGQFLWANSFDGSGEGVALDSSKHAYVLGDSIMKYDSTGVLIWKDLDTCNFESISINTNKILTIGSENGILCVTQQDTASNDIWHKPFSGNSGYVELLGMVTDSLGNIYTYSYTSNDLDFYGTEVAKGLFVSKQNSNGEVVWINELHGVELSVTFGIYMDIDPTHKYIFITGEFEDPLVIPGQTTLIPDANGSTFVAKYRTDGTYKWAIKEDVEEDCQYVSADYSGGVVICGVFRGNETIAGTSLTSLGGNDVYVAKYDTDGNPLWAIRAGGDATEYSGVVSVDGANNVYLSGEFLSEDVTIDQTAITLSEGDGNIIYAKLNSNGDVQWVKSLAGSTVPGGDGHSWATGIVTDIEGYTYLKGWSGDSTSFDDITLYSPYGFGYSYFIAKLDPNGTTLWANAINRKGLGFDYNQMDVDASGNVYLGAHAYDSLYFNDELEYKNVGAQDFFVAKYTNAGDLDWVKFVQSPNSWLSSVVVCDNEFVGIGGYFNQSILFNDPELKSTNKNGFIALINNDNAKPVITNCPDDSTIRVNATTEFIIPNLTDEVEATDNYSNVNDLIITQSPTEGTVLKATNDTIQPVIISVSDENGNISTCTVSLSFEIIDNTKPTITSCPDDRNVTLNESSELVVPALTEEVTATDDFTPATDLIITQSPKSDVHLTSANGNTHEVIISVQDESGNTQTCTVILTGEQVSNIDDLISNKLQVYPVPSKDKVYINIPVTAEAKRNTHLKIFDICGKVIFSKNLTGNNEFVITKEDVKYAGIYIFKIENGNTYSGKIVFY